MMRYLKAKSWKSLWLSLFFVVLIMLVLLWQRPEINIEKLSDFNGKVSISIVDDDRSFLSNILCEQFVKQENINNVYVESLEAAKNRLLQGEIVMILQIPQKFMQQTQQYVQRAPLSVWLNPKAPAESATVAQLLRNYANVFSDMQSDDYAMGLVLKNDIYPRVKDYDANKDFYEEKAWQRATFAAGDLVSDILGRQQLLTVPKHKIYDPAKSFLMTLVLLFAGVFSVAVVFWETRDSKRQQRKRQRSIVGALSLYGSEIFYKLLIMSVWSILPAFIFAAQKGVAAFFVVFASLLFAEFCLLTIAYLLVQSGLNSAEGTLLQLFLLYLLMILGGGIYPRSLFSGILQYLQWFSPFNFAVMALESVLYNATLEARSLVCSILCSFVTLVIVAYAVRQRYSTQVFTREKILAFRR